MCFSNVVNLLDLIGRDYNLFFQSFWSSYVSQLFGSSRLAPISQAVRPGVPGHLFSPPSQGSQSLNLKRPNLTNTTNKTLGQLKKIRNQHLTRMKKGHN